MLNCLRFRHSPSTLVREQSKTGNKEAVVVNKDDAMDDPRRALDGNALVNGLDFLRFSCSKAILVPLLGGIAASYDWTTICPVSRRLVL